MKPRPTAWTKRHGVLAALRALPADAFTTAELAKLLGRTSRRSTPGMFAARLVQVGALVRLRPGLFALPERVPRGVGPMLEHVAAGAPFQVAFRSAMAAHGFGAAPEVLQVAILGHRRRDPRLSPTLRARFLQRRGARMLAEEERREVPGAGELPVTTLEATLLDALTEPHLCGGFDEVLRFVSWGRGKWSGEALVASLKRRKRDALTRRVGYLLERIDDPVAKVIARELLPNPWAWTTWLVPRAAFFGPLDARWRLRLNHDASALEAALRLPAVEAPEPRRRSMDPWAQAFEREFGR